MSGQSNYLGMVTSYKMRETEMGYRGSKSVIFYNIIVKEQRVDGSYFVNNSKLRCTLIETNFVFYLTIYLTNLEQKKHSSSYFYLISEPSLP
jgi:hypothetical protein